MKSTGKCSCCRDDNVEVQSFDLPVFGSEGVWLCLQCRKDVCKFIYGKCTAGLRERRDEVIKRKRIERAVYGEWSGS